MGSLFQANIADRGLVLDPRTKLFCLLTIFIFVLGGMGKAASDWLKVALSILPIVLFFTAKQWKKGTFYLVLYTAANLGYRYLISGIHGTAHFVLGMICMIILILMPGLMMGAYTFATTTVSEVIATMERMHIPMQITIPLSVMFRFFPTVVEEFDSIGRAMEMRDISLGGKNRGKLVEYRLIPLLVCSVRIGSELSAAALTRGLGTDRKRTNICRIGFHAQDFVLFALMLAPYLNAILSKAGVLP